MHKLKRKVLSVTNELTNGPTLIIESFALKILPDHAREISELMNNKNNRIFKMVR